MGKRISKFQIFFFAEQAEIETKRVARGYALNSRDCFRTQTRFIIYSIQNNVLNNLPNISVSALSLGKELRHFV